MRIGNILDYKGDLVHVTWLSCDIDDEYEESIHFCSLGKTTNERGGWNRAICKDLKRVPLTPEWLERMGFSFRERPGFFDQWDGSEEISIEEGREQGAYVLFGSEWTIGKPFRYVHQLQNLYFALTGKEITIK